MQAAGGHVFTEWCTNVTHPSKRYEVRSDVHAEASKPCKPKWNAIDAVGNRSNNEMHGGAAPRPDMHRWQSGEVAVKKMKTRSREPTAADEMECTAARHMSWGCMQRPTMQKTCTSKSCKMNVVEKHAKNMKCMCLVSSTPAGLRPNTNVGLHIPFGLGSVCGCSRASVKFKREYMEYWPSYVTKPKCIQRKYTI